MNIVLWGAGEFGRRILKRIPQNVVAIIDNDKKKIGTYFYGKQIISYEQYKEQYEQFFIFIATLYDNEISDFLCREGNYKFFRTTDLPGEWFDYNERSAYKKYIESIISDRECAVYGCTFHALVLAELIEKKTGKRPFLVVNDDERHSLVEEINRHICKTYELPEIKKKEIDIIYNATNINCNALKDINAGIVETWDCSGIIEEYQHNELKKYKNKYCKKRCFVIGNGPSLLASDLTKLYENKEICFGVNKIYDIYSKTVWRPDYYMAADVWWLSTGEMHRSINPTDYKACFVSDAIDESIINKIHTSAYCNSSCIYCNNHYEKKGIGYDPTSMLMEFADKDLYDQDCLFDWGGGEPTQNPFFGNVVSYLSSKGYYQRINTNGIDFSDATYQAMKRGRTNLRLSIDSGSRECFEKIKGHSYYDEVWNNIKRYREASADIDVKYNVFNMNSDHDEIDIFLNKCKECDIKSIHIDAEISSYQPALNAGPFYFTKKEWEAAHYMQDKGIGMGFKVTVSPYAFRSRAEYENGELALPKKYFDNIDYQIISNGNKITTFANIKELEKMIDFSHQYILIGDASFIKLGEKFLGSKGCVYEKYISMEEYAFENKQDRQLPKCFVLMEHNWKHSLKKINEIGDADAKVYWVPLKMWESFYEDEIIKYPFPFEWVTGGNIVIYGYGKVGKAYINQIASKREYNIVCIVDQKFKESNQIGETKHEVTPHISDAMKKKYDFIIIAMINKMDALEVRDTLLSFGIEESKIIFTGERFAFKEQIEQKNEK